MKNNYAFYYEVRFKFLAFTNEKDVNAQTFCKQFKAGSPLENREEAFEYFHEYLSYLEQNKRLSKDEFNNYQIKIHLFSQYLIGFMQ